LNFLLRAAFRTKPTTETASSACSKVSEPARYPTAAEIAAKQQKAYAKSIEDRVEEAVTTVLDRLGACVSPAGKLELNTLPRLDLLAGDARVALVADGVRAALEGIGFATVKVGILPIEVDDLLPPSLPNAFLEVDIKHDAALDRPALADCSALARSKYGTAQQIIETARIINRKEICASVDYAMAQIVEELSSAMPPKSPAAPQRALVMHCSRGEAVLDGIRKALNAMGYQHVEFADHSGDLAVTVSQLPPPKPDATS
jgi:hypothetical protein